MRASVVKRRYGLLFFTTRSGGERVLVGYYRLRWYAPTQMHSSPADFALAADKIRFVFPAIRADDLPRSAAAVLKKPFRIFKTVDEPTCAEFLKALNQRADRTPLYLEEIDRLERFNKAHTGFRYVAWGLKTPFSWANAADYLRAPTPDAHARSTRGSTTSPTDTWQCKACDATIRNKALLKRCPTCGKIGTLSPVGL